MKSRYQVFIEELFESLFSLIKIILLSKPIKKKHISRHSNELVIMGNSPNLQQSVESHPVFLENKDLVGVNFFMKTELFKKLKPANYIISSGNYWAKGMIDGNAEGREAAFKELAEYVDWPMTLFVPVLAKKHNEWKKVLKANKFITIEYYNLTPVQGLQCINNFMYAKHLGLPRPHNVLVPAIILGINAGYSKIYLLGAEHSWLKDIYVADNNKAYLTQKHFYNDKEAKPEVMYLGSKNDERNLAQMLMKFVYTFNSYFIIRKYAEKKGVKVINATKGSYIDAFERIKLEDHK